MLAIILFIIYLCQATQEKKVPNLEHDQIEIFTLEDVEYLFFRYEVIFDEALVICLHYKGQLADLNTKKNANFVTKTTNKLELEELWIGASSNNLWFWTDNNKKLKFDHTSIDGFPLSDPADFFSNDDNCLTIYRKRHNIPTLIPLQWLNKSSFICKREKIFWTDEMENAWSGRYLKNNVWKWVASNKKMDANELWTNNSKISTGCLLLDRHICEDPIYVSAKCDRKRNILCQKREGHFVSHRVQEDVLRNSDFLNLYSGLADMKPVKMPAIALSQNSSRETEQENVPLLYEDISNMKKFHSTESYYTSSVSYALQQHVNFVLDKATFFIIKEISARFKGQHNSEDGRQNSQNETKHDDNSIEANETNFLNFVTKLFNPLVQFTLPSLPQFGIRVVSAEEANPESEVKNNSSQSSNSKESKELTLPEKLNHKLKSSRKKISSLNFNPTHNSNNFTNDFQNQNGVSTTEQSTTTTAEVNTISGSLYGENIDYDDAPPSSATGNVEKTEPTSNNGILKSNETLINNLATNITHDLNISAILQKVIEEELTLMNQKDLMSESSTSEKKPTNLYLESTNKTQNEIEVNKIPPYYPIESPLSVELNEDTDKHSEDAVNFTPVLRILDQTDKPKFSEQESKSRISNSDESSDYFDLGSLKIDPYDKDSMLQLGRFLKSKFADKTSNAQTINFNLISNQNLPEEILQNDNSQSWQEKNYLQRDIKGQKKYYNEIISTTTSSISSSVPHSTENSGCQSVPSLPSGVKPEFAQQPCGQTPVLVPLIQLIRAPQLLPEIISNPNKIENEKDDNGENETKINKERERKNSNESKNGSVNQRSGNGTKHSQKTLFSIFKNLVNGVRIDIKEIQLKSYVQRFVKEKFPHLAEYDFAKSKLSWHKNFKKILELLNGTTVRFHGEKVQLRIASFVYKKQSPNQETRIKNRMKIGPFIENENSFNKDNYNNKDHSFVKNKLSSKQKNPHDNKRKVKYFQREISLRSHKTIKNTNKLVKKSIKEENSFPPNGAESSTDGGFDSTRFVRSNKIENASAVVSLYFILKQFDANDSIPILELHIRMPANSNPNSNSDQDSRDYQSLNKVSKFNNAEKLENTQMRKKEIQKLSERRKKSNQNYTATNYKKRNDLMKNIMSNVTSLRSFSDLRRKRQLLFLALKYLTHITEESQKNYPPADENDGHLYLNRKDDKENKMLNIAQIKNALQPGIYPGIQNRLSALNLIQNDFNPGTGVFNSISNRNYVDMRRNLHSLTNPRYGLFNNYQQESNKN